MIHDDTHGLLQSLIDAGDSQAEIARQTGVQQATISRILAGQHMDPLTSTTRRIQEYAAKRLKRKPGRSRR